MRAFLAILAVALFAGLTTGGVILAVQNSHLHDQVNTLVVERDARHAAFCHLLHGLATAKRVPPEVARLAGGAVSPEGCPH